VTIDKFPTRRRYIDIKKKNLIYSEIIDASISDIVTSHQTIINELIDRDSGKKSQYSLLKVLISACKSMLSVLYSLRLIFRNDLPLYNGKSCVLIYSPNFKTYKEAINITNEIKTSTKFNCIILTNEEIIDTCSEDLLRIPITKHSRIQFRTFLGVLSKFVIGLRYFLFSDRRWLLNLILISNYANNERTIFFIKKIIENYKVRSILNFFAATNFGRQLNNIGLQENVKVFSYCWGSNMKAIEQEYTKQDILLVKYPAEKNKYPEHTFKYSKVVGDITVINCHGTQKGIERKYLLFLDTCYSFNFNRSEKEELVIKAFQVMDRSLFVVYKWHPASKDRESLKRQLESIHDNMSFVSGEYDVNCLIKGADAVININSTLLINCIELNKTTFNLFPLFCELTDRPLTEDCNFMMEAPVYNAASFETLASYIQLYRDNNLPGLGESVIKEYKMKYIPYMGNEAVKNIVKEILLFTNQKLPEGLQGHMVNMDRQL
jgi:hypothetical protein